MKLSAKTLDDAQHALNAWIAEKALTTEKRKTYHIKGFRLVETTIKFPKNPVIFREFAEGFDFSDAPELIRQYQAVLRLALERLNDVDYRFLDLLFGDLYDELALAARKRAQSLALEQHLLDFRFEFDEYLADLSPNKLKVLIGYMDRTLENFIHQIETDDNDDLDLLLALRNFKKIFDEIYVQCLIESPEFV